MSVSYKKLWKLLIDHNMNKGELAKATKMSANTLAKLGKNETVSMDILVRICTVLKCDIGVQSAVTNGHWCGGKRPQCGASAASLS